MDDLAELMTVTEAAKYLGLYRETLLRLIMKGEIPSFKLGGRHFLHRGILEEFFREKAKQTSEAAQK